MSQTSHRPAPFSPATASLERLPQPVVVHRRDLRPDELIAPHRHRRAQLVYASAGVMTVTTADGAIVLPDERGVWMPAGVEHRIEARTAVAMRTLYVDPRRAPGLPAQVRVVHVTPLLRELILEAAARGNDYAPGSPEERIMEVILDQVRVLPEAPLTLPIPRDPRLLRITAAMQRDPADPRGLAAWARTTGASERTLSRLFATETGMTFRAWRRQLRLLRALEQLAAGTAVTRVALDLGYESNSAFSAMFRRALGTPPTRYFARDGRRTRVYVDGTSSTVGDRHAV